MTAPKKPEDRLIAYPTTRAKQGMKTKARETARAAGLKSFYWKCPKHGMTPFSTAGSGTCRRCIAEAQRAAKLRTKAAKTEITTNE
ncbi:hypothetical protein VSR68_29110 [Paraburkholderia phymatum]|uniref:hypothetical protein n=1 Tax=Paraburkholderia phymatum TaxID=148447 RepID=UPI00316C6D1D